jgi:mannan endo-1,4-beta-mannosidase
MIPMIELHDATCDITKLPAIANYWTKPEVVQLIERYQHALLINIANEAGNEGVTAGVFLQAYQAAITQIRNAGIHTPLVIDAPDCGKNLDVLLATFSQLTAHDPDKNLLFSVHPYWSQAAIQQFATPTFIKDHLQKAVAANMPLILGELCGYGGWPGENAAYTESCQSKGVVDYKALLQQSQVHNIGWLLWEWGPGNGYYEFNPPILCPTMDITTNGTYNSILAVNNSSPNAWAKEAVIDSPYGIQKTSVKTAYLQNGFRCPK